MIYESRAIVAYLARTNGGVEKGFIPGADDSLAMAKYDQAFSTEAASVSCLWSHFDPRR